MSGTVGDLIKTVHAQFLEAGLAYGHGTDNAWDEAVALVLQAGNWPDEQASLAIAVRSDELDVIEQMTTARIRDRVPLPYIFERCQYMGLEFLLAPGVVVPRSPIGFLLGGALDPWLPKQVNSILDLCSGSGCLGIVAAYAFPDSSVKLLEIDTLACEFAQRNIDLHGLNNRVEVIQGDVTDAHSILRQEADLILSNPPYVDATDMASLPPEYLAEPARGLAAGTDGLLVINSILSQLVDLMTPQAVFVGEVGASAAALIQKYPNLPFTWLDLPEGGEGVFLLEAHQLSSHTARGTD